MTMFFSWFSTPKMAVYCGGQGSGIPVFGHISQQSTRILAVEVAEIRSGDH